MKAIIMGGTSGIGKSIADQLKNICDELIVAGSKEVDTTSIVSVKEFIKKNKKTNILVLNTGGPKDLKFNEINDTDWTENFNRLFLSFSKIIKEIEVQNDGYIFLISSYIIKQPGDELIISSSLRAGFTNLFKSLSIIYEVFAKWRRLFL